MKVLLAGIIKKGNSEDFIFNAFKQLNIEVHLVNYDEYFKYSFFNKVLNKFIKTPYYFGVKLLNKRLIEKTKKFRPDFILLLKPIIILPKTVSELTKITKVFSWYPDYILFPKTCSAYFYKSIPLYDCHFSFNFENSKELLKFGAKKSIFLPCAADPSCHHPVSASPEEVKKIGADIIFVGTYADEERFWHLERLCQEGYDIKIYGNSWEKCPKNSCLIKKGYVQFREICCEEISKVFNASKIVLSFVREHNKETLACRTYEIPASGGFMLHQRTAKTDEAFKEGEEAVFFSSYEELKEKIDFYLKNKNLREKIMQKGRERVLRENLFIHRIQYIIEVFKQLS